MRIWDWLHFLISPGKIIEMINWSLKKKLNNKVKDVVFKIHKDMFILALFIFNTIECVYLSHEQKTWCENRSQNIFYYAYSKCIA